ncbi:tRNA (guanosine(46)-N7)-methyltransferase TrmB [Rhabdobacter roseus]|uniref:tRNA (guanine-N(7)-)-methyltransferase n=1 Tax=Rhabdobacter roseus TaxID=1655419 RepID=A0A840TT25_9BACT|nr:tRNA (guanine-N7-)-methyltransferase [Rhabdobacter roseus]
MGRKKLERFHFVAQVENVIERGKEFYTTIQGRWNELYFKNANPLVLELACGKGEYTLGLAQRFPDKNFIGIDIKGDRIAKGSREALELGLDNVAFLRAGIKYLDEFFVPQEISEIWLIHPDPRVREREENVRLTNPAFLSQYARYLKPGGIFHLKTDSVFLYEYSLRTLAAHPDYTLLAHTADLYTSPLLEEHHGIVTHYERIFVNKGSTVHHIKARVEK